VKETCAELQRDGKESSLALRPQLFKGKARGVCQEVNPSVVTPPSSVFFIHTIIGSVIRKGLPGHHSQSDFKLLQCLVIRMSTNCLYNPWKGVVGLVG